MRLQSQRSFSGGAHCTLSDLNDLGWKSRPVHYGVHLKIATTGMLLTALVLTASGELIAGKCAARLRRVTAKLGANVVRPREKS